MARKKCTTRVRTRGKRVLNSYSRMVKHFAYIQDATNWTEWTFRNISQRQAEQHVSAGEAERVTREVVLEDGTAQVQVVGYRALSPTSWEPGSPATLTMGTMIAVANAVGEKKDVRLTRHERDQIFKFRIWPAIGDTKAVRVGPAMQQKDLDAMTPIERHFAQQLIKQNSRMTRAA